MAQRYRLLVGLGVMSSVVTGIGVGSAYLLELVMLQVTLFLI